MIDKQVCYFLWIRPFRLLKLHVCHICYFMVISYIIFDIMTPKSGASFIKNNLLQHDNHDRNLIHVVLKLPWSHTLLTIDHHCLWKTKCLSLQVASKLGPSLNREAILEVLDLGLRDEAEEVRIEAVNSIPVMVLWSGHDLLSPVFKRME